MLSKGNIIILIALNRYHGVTKLLLKKYCQGLPNRVRNVPTKQGRHVKVCKRISFNSGCWPQSKDGDIMLCVGGGGGLA